jgi:hypothetical protein
MENAQKRIEELFNLCLVAMQRDRRSIEDCLASYPAEREELEPLLNTVVRLEAAQALQAPPRFKAESCQRLKALASTKPQARKSLGILTRLAFLSNRRDDPAFPRQKPHFAYLLAGLLLVIIITVGLGTVAVSAQALPGDVFYPVKIVQEELQLSLTVNVADQADLHLQYANRRMSEASALIEQRRTSSLDQTLVDYSRHMQIELDFLSPGSSLTPDQQSDLAEKLLNEKTLSETSLSALIPNTPSSSQSNLETALATSRKAYSQAVDVLSTQDSNLQPTPSLPPAPSATSRPAYQKPTATQSPTATSLPTRTRPTLTPTASQKPSISNGTTAPTSLPPSIRPSATLPPTKVIPSATGSRTPSTNSSGAATATRPPAPNAVKPTATK